MRIGITTPSESNRELSALVRNIEGALDGRAEVFAVRDHSRRDARRRIRWLRDLDVWIGVGRTEPRMCEHSREAGVRSVIVAEPDSSSHDVGFRVDELSAADACVVFRESAARELQNQGLRNVCALPLAPAEALRNSWWALLRRIGPKLLNLGAGEQPHPGMVNLDIRPLPGIQIVASASALPFRDTSFDGLLAQDLLEHFPASQIDGLLDEWVRVLRPGARVRIQTPDVRALARAMLRGRLSTERTVEWLYGAQDHAFNFHQTGFDEPRLRALLAARGIVELRRDRISVSSKNVCLEGRRSPVVHRELTCRPESSAL